MRAHVALNSILKDLERHPSQTLPVNLAYVEREERECGEPGYSGSLLLTRLSSCSETNPPIVNRGSAQCFKTDHGNSNVRFFTVSVKRGGVS